MKLPDLRLSDLDSCFPDDFTPEQRARARTLFYEELAIRVHRYYRGKMTALPKAGIFSPAWLSAYYTPGVSKISTTIRDDPEASFELTNRGNLVAIVSDSSRVLGDGDVGAAGGLGVMEGKALLMKYLGGVDAVPLCITSASEQKAHDPAKIIDFVRMLEPSFGAVNLEDISSPNCFQVLDALRESCDIPVWHDDAQGTACVTLAGLLGALRVVEKELAHVKVVLLGAGAANLTAVRLLLAAGADPDKMIVLDSRGSLHRNRSDLGPETAFNKKWEVARLTNPGCAEGPEEALKGADVLIAASRPGPHTVKGEWVRRMAPSSIVFACANPVPEIYPYEALEAGAQVVATGRGDFPNQVNNALGFPGILKGALLVRARKITDRMAIAAAYALADYVKDNERPSVEHIMPTLNDVEVFAREAEAVARQAQEDGVARVSLPPGAVFARSLADIKEAQLGMDLLVEKGIINTPPLEILEESLRAALAKVM